MAVTRTDRDRRILGDRVVAREAEFRAISGAVGEVYELFIAEHQGMSERTAERLKEESEDDLARRKRDEAASDGVRQYSWAFHRVPALLGESWVDGVDEAALTAARDRIFPLGAPTAVVVSHQRTLDGLIHLVEGMGDDSPVKFPAEFKATVIKTRDALRAAIGGVTQDSAETETATAAQLKARARWDLHWLALREVTAGYLRLAGQTSRHAGLFRSLARKTGGAGQSTVEADDGLTPGADGPPVDADPVVDALAG